MRLLRRFAPRNDKIKMLLRALVKQFHNYPTLVNGALVYQFLISPLPLEGEGEGEGEVKLVIASLPLNISLGAGVAISSFWLNLNYSSLITHYAINLPVNCYKGGENKWPPN